MAFWGLEVKPGKQPAVLNLERRLVVKQAALVVAKPDPTPCVRGVLWVRRGIFSPSTSRDEVEAFIGLSRRALTVGADAAQFPPAPPQFAARRPPHDARTDPPHRPRRRRQRW